MFCALLVVQLWRTLHNLLTSSSRAIKKDTIETQHKGEKYTQGGPRKRKGAVSRVPIGG